MVECKKCGKQYNVLPTSDINLCPVCSKKKKGISLFISAIINIAFIIIFYVLKSNVFKYLNPKAALLFNISFYVLIFIGISIMFYGLIKYFSE